MIQWQNNYGEHLNLTISGYEFPDIHEDYDANWLFLHLDGNYQGVNWKGKDPCFLTWDLLELQYWFEEILEGMNGFDSFIVLETDLQIQLITTHQTSFTFAVILKSNLSALQDEKTVMFFTPTEDELQYTIDQLKLLQKKYPPRGDQKLIDSNINWRKDRHRMFMKEEFTTLASKLCGFTENGFLKILHQGGFLITSQWKDPEKDYIQLNVSRKKEEVSIVFNHPVVFKSDHFQLISTLYNIEPISLKKLEQHYSKWSSIPKNHLQFYQKEYQSIADLNKLSDQYRGYHVTGSGNLSFYIIAMDIQYYR